jgi:opacity protein-like surface antigen
MEADAIAGYDFGQFRVEAELGWKRTNREGLQIDPAFLDFLSVALHRPSSVVWDPGAPGMQALTQSDFASLDGKVSTKSAMINVLADFETPSAVEIYAGAGLGRAWARALNDSDSAWAGQLIAGVRTSVRPNVKMGLKYRYFRTATVKFEGGPLHIPGNPYTNFIGDIMFVQQDTADVIPRLNGRLQSHSLLVSLTFDLGKNGPD